MIELNFQGAIMKESTVCVISMSFSLLLTTAGIERGAGGLIVTGRPEAGVRADHLSKQRAENQTYCWVFSSLGHAPYELWPSSTKQNANECDCLDIISCFGRKEVLSFLSMGQLCLYFVGRFHVIPSLIARAHFLSFRRRHLVEERQCHQPHMKCSATVSFFKVVEQICQVRLDDQASGDLCSSSWSYKW